MDLPPIVLWRRQCSTASDDAGIDILKYELPTMDTTGPYEQQTPTYNYVPCLAFFAIKKLVDYPDQIDIGRVRLVYKPPTSRSSYDILRALMPDFDPNSKDSLKSVDPRLWAVLIQIFMGLPDALRTYSIPLSDKYLPFLQRIPTSTEFSLITVLDLNGCLELTDDTISELKVLHALCAFDASRTSLTSHGLYRFSNGLCWSEDDQRQMRGPWALRMLRLRGCRSINNEIFRVVSRFPLLTVLDLRDTNCMPLTRSLPTGFHATHDDGFFHPTPILTSLRLLCSASSTLLSSSNIFTLHVTTLCYSRLRPSQPFTPDVAMQDAYVFLPPVQNVKSERKTKPDLSQTKSTPGRSSSPGIKYPRMIIGNSNDLARETELRNKGKHQRHSDPFGQPWSWEEADPSEGSSPRYTNKWDCGDPFCYECAGNGWDSQDSEEESQDSEEEESQDSEEESEQESADEDINIDDELASISSDPNSNAEEIVSEPDVQLGIHGNDSTGDESRAATPGTAVENEFGNEFVTNDGPLHDLPSNTVTPRSPIAPEKGGRRRNTMPVRSPLLGQAPTTPVTRRTKRRKTSMSGRIAEAQSGAEELRLQHDEGNARRSHFPEPERQPRPTRAEDDSDVRALPQPQRRRSSPGTLPLVSSMLRVDTRSQQTSSTRSATASFPTRHPSTSRPSSVGAALSDELELENLIARAEGDEHRVREEMSSFYRGQAHKDDPRAAARRMVRNTPYISDRNRSLMLYREPPPWSVLETICRETERHANHQAENRSKEMGVNKANTAASSGIRALNQEIQKRREMPSVTAHPVVRPSDEIPVASRNPFARRSEPSKQGSGISGTLGAPVKPLVRISTIRQPAFPQDMRGRNGRENPSIKDNFLISSGVPTKRAGFRPPGSKPSLKTRQEEPNAVQSSNTKTPSHSFRKEPVKPRGFDWKEWSKK